MYLATHYTNVQMQYNYKHLTIDYFMGSRFKVEQKIDMRSTLQELGIKNIFTSDADLSAMTGDKHSGVM